MTLGATLFPLAIRAHEESVGDTVGTMICQSALTVARASLKPADVGSNLDDVTDVSGEYAYCVPAPTTDKPTGSGNSNAEWTEVPPGSSSGEYDPATLKGAVVLAREVSEQRHDYQLLAVAYTKAAAENRVKAQEVNNQLSIVFDDDRAGYVATDEGGNGLFRKGGVIILTNGDVVHHAMIKSVFDSNNRALLETPLLPGNPFWLVLELDYEGNTPLVRNPVMCVMSTRAALRPQ